MSFEAWFDRETTRLREREQRRLTRADSYICDPETGELPLAVSFGPCEHCNTGSYVAFGSIVCCGVCGMPPKSAER